MSSKLTILTGASRGLGLSMACQLLDAGHHVLCLARSTSNTLLAHPLAGDRLTNWQADLADAPSVALKLGQWLQSQRQDWHRVTLINNAGVIPTIAPLSQLPPDDLSQALRVGIEAPMALTAVFLHHTAHWPGQRRVLNISSGLGRRPMASQATYCAAKAAMDHFTRCLALEEAAKPAGAHVCSLAPGVIDTAMQTQLRSASPDAFPDLANFQQLKANRQLAPPDEAAARVLAYLDRPDFGQQPVADIRE